MHPFEEQQIRDESRDAASNLEGLRATLGRVATEHSYLEGRFNATLDAIQDANARILAANKRGGVVDLSGRAGVNTLGVPERPERLNAQLDFERAQADRKLAEVEQAPLTSRMAQLEHLRTRIRRAILVEEPRVVGLAEQVAEFDRPPAPEPAPEPAPAAVSETRVRLAAIGERLALR